MLITIKHDNKYKCTCVYHVYRIIQLQYIRCVHRVKLHYTSTVPNYKFYRKAGAKLTSSYVQNFIPELLKYSSIPGVLQDSDVTNSGNSDDFYCYYQDKDSGNSDGFVTTAKTKSMAK